MRGPLLYVTYHRLDSLRPQGIVFVFGSGIAPTSRFSFCFSVPCIFGALFIGVRNFYNDFSVCGVGVARASGTRQAQIRHAEQKPRK